MLGRLPDKQKTCLRYHSCSDVCVCVCIVELFHLGHFKSSKYLQIPLLKNDLIHVWNGFRRVRKKIYQACNNKRFSLEGGVQEKTCLTLEANNFYDKKKKRGGGIFVCILILFSTPLGI